MLSVWHIGFSLWSKSDFWRIQVTKCVQLFELIDSWCVKSWWLLIDTLTCAKLKQYHPPNKNRDKTPAAAVDLATVGLLFAGSDSDRVVLWQKPFLTRKTELKRTICRWSCCSCESKACTGVTSLQTLYIVLLCVTVCLLTRNGLMTGCFTSGSAPGRFLLITPRWVQKSKVAWSSIHRNPEGFVHSFVLSFFSSFFLSLSFFSLCSLFLSFEVYWTTSRAFLSPHVGEPWKHWIHMSERWQLFIHVLEVLITTSD